MFLLMKMSNEIEYIFGILYVLFEFEMKSKKSK